MIFVSKYPRKAGGGGRGEQRIERFSPLSTRHVYVTFPSLPLPTLFTSSSSSFFSPLCSGKRETTSRFFSLVKFAPRSELWFRRNFLLFFFHEEKRGERSVDRGSRIGDDCAQLSTANECVLDAFSSSDFASR